MTNPPMNRNPVTKRKRPTSNHQRIDIGQMILIRPGTSPEGIWLQRVGAEGMEVSVPDLEALLLKYFKKNF